MAIPKQHRDRYIFHFTDMSNLDSIIKNGLLCTNIKNDMGIPHRNIANMTIQGRRANMDVPVGPGGKVHDYVPFYFSSINPMLLTLLNQKNVDQHRIVYLCVKIQRLEKDDAVYTDASANTVEPPAFYDNTSCLDDLDWDLIESRKWSVDSEENKHKKMAEALIFNKVDISEINAIVVFNDWAKKSVQKVFEDNEINPPDILLDNNSRMRKYGFYYTKFFFEDRKYETLVTGPLMLSDIYRNLIAEIKKKRNEKRSSYKYSTIHDLLEALDKNIYVIPELKDVEGLLQDYSPHNDTVDDHTKKVVEAMKNLDYYNTSTNEKKDILLLPSYLHDIGKGPKRKWNNGVMARAYPDHTADAIPMLERILTEEIGILSDEEIRMICMLVVYHDIVGDCVGNGRDKNQIVELIEGIDDLDMLLAISEADSKAIKGAWILGVFGRKKSFISQIMEMKSA